jgi:hypothetical protein
MLRLHMCFDLAIRHLCGGLLLCFNFSGKAVTNLSAAGDPPKDIFRIPPSETRRNLLLIIEPD